MQLMVVAFDFVSDLAAVACSRNSWDHSPDDDYNSKRPMDCFVDRTNHNRHMEASYMVVESFEGLYNDNFHGNNFDFGYMNSSMDCYP